MRDLWSCDSSGVTCKRMCGYKSMLIYNVTYWHLTSLNAGQMYVTISINKKLSISVIFEPHVQFERCSSRNTVCVQPIANIVTCLSSKKFTLISAVLFFNPISFGKQVLDNLVVDIAYTEHNFENVINELIISYCYLHNRAQWFIIDTIIPLKTCTWCSTTCIPWYYINNINELWC